MSQRLSDMNLHISGDDVYMNYSNERLIGIIKTAVRRARRNDCVLEGYVIFRDIICYQTISNNIVKYYYTIDSEESFANVNLVNLTKKDLIHLIYVADSLDLIH
jgi:hypothetical protein